MNAPLPHHHPQNPECWFVVGSQHLYGPEALDQVARNARHLVDSLNASGKLPIRLVLKETLTTPDAVTSELEAANGTANCIGVVAWMHTFSPAKMWVRGLSLLRKPLLHLHTQFYRDLPWSSIDMDFMNLHQSAHGDREFGFINARLRRPRAIVAGHWESERVQSRMGCWMQAALGWHAWQGAKIARFGDNMRQVAVTDGDKVAAEARLGFTVDGFGVGDLVAVRNDVDDALVDALCADYETAYDVVPELQRGGARHESLREEARTEAALRTFLDDGGYAGFTTTFEDLHGLPMLPGLAAQRLMAAGYGFAAEGDWKTTALLYAMKVMAQGDPRGVSFMEDYTYHLEEGAESVLGAHMLEICPSIAASKPRLEIHPLGIGGKADPVRLVFDAAAGPGLNASLVDMGNRFRLIINEVDVVAMPEPLPKLPVARALWRPKPDFETGLEGWILAGGAHHTGFTQALQTEHFEHLAEMAGLETVVIDESATMRSLRTQLRLQDQAWAHDPAPGH